MNFYMRNRLPGQIEIGLVWFRLSVVSVTIGCTTSSQVGKGGLVWRRCVVFNVVIVRRVVSLSYMIVMMIEVFNFVMIVMMIVVFNM